MYSCPYDVDGEIGGKCYLLELLVTMMQLVLSVMH